MSVLRRITRDTRLLATAPLPRADRSTIATSTHSGPIGSFPAASVLRDRSTFSSKVWVSFWVTALVIAKKIQTRPATSPQRSTRPQLILPTATSDRRLHFLPAPSLPDPIDSATRR